MSWLALAILEYESANGQYPQTLEDLRGLYGAGSNLLNLKQQTMELQASTKSFDDVLRNVWTGDDPGFEYVKPTKDTRLDDTILYHLRDGKRVTDAPTARLDGSVR